MKTVAHTKREKAIMMENLVRSWLLHLYVCMFTSYIKDRANRVKTWEGEIEAKKKILFIFSFIKTFFFRNKCIVRKLCFYHEFIKLTMCVWRHRCRCRLTSKDKKGKGVFPYYALCKRNADKKALIKHHAKIDKANWKNFFHDRTLFGFSTTNRNPSKIISKTLWWKIFLTLHLFSSLFSLIHIVFCSSPISCLSIMAKSSCTILHFSHIISFVTLHEKFSFFVRS